MLRNWLEDWGVEDWKLLDILVWLAGYQYPAVYRALVGCIAVCQRNNKEIVLEQWHSCMALFQSTSHILQPSIQASNCLPYRSNLHIHTITPNYIDTKPIKRISIYITWTLTSGGDIPKRILPGALSVHSPILTCSQSNPRDTNPNKRRYPHLPRIARITGLNGDPGPVPATVPCDRESQLYP